MEVSRDRFRSARRIKGREKFKGGDGTPLVAGEEAGTRPAGQNTQMPPQANRMSEDARQFPAQALARKGFIASV